MTPSARTIARIACGVAALGLSFTARGEVSAQPGAQPDDGAHSSSALLELPDPGAPSVQRKAGLVLGVAGATTFVTGLSLMVPLLVGPGCWSGGWECDQPTTRVILFAFGSIFAGLGFTAAMIGWQKLSPASLGPGIAVTAVGVSLVGLGIGLGDLPVGVTGGVVTALGGFLLTMALIHGREDAAPLSLAPILSPDFVGIGLGGRLPVLTT